jgi:hypothetical protein
MFRVKREHDREGRKNVQAAAIGNMIRQCWVPSDFIFHYRGYELKAMTLRLSAEQAEALETVADIESMPASEVIRAAITEHIDSRKNDPAFQESLKDRLNRARRPLRK